MAWVVEKGLNVLVALVREDIKKNCRFGENVTIGGGGGQKNY